MGRDFTRFPRLPGQQPVYSGLPPDAHAFICVAFDTDPLIGER